MTSVLLPQGIVIDVKVSWAPERLSGVPGPVDTVTSRVIGPVSFTRGRPVDAVSVGNLVTGECSFTLLNLDGRYSPNNVDSPLNDLTARSKVSAGRMIQVTFAPLHGRDFPMWTGLTTEITTRLEARGKPVVDIKGAGPLWLFGDSQDEYDDGTTRTAQSLAEQILESPQFSPEKYLGGLHHASDWTREITGWKMQGTGMALLGNLELREAGQELQETKQGTIYLPPATAAADWAAMFNDTNGVDEGGTPFIEEYDADGSIKPIFQVSAVEEISAESLVYDCFSYSLASNTQILDYPADVFAGGVLLGKWTAPPPDAANALKSNGHRAGMWDYPLAEAFVDGGFQVDRTIFKLAKSNGGNDPTDLAPALSFTHNTLSSPLASLWTIKSPTNPKQEVEWRIERDDRETGTDYWLLEIEFYGIRKYQPAGDADAIFCEERGSVIEVYGRREFPAAPRFLTEAEAATWVSIMAARYSEDRLRLTCTITPTNSQETLSLAALDLGDRILLRLREASGMWLPIPQHGIIRRIEWAMDAQRLWRVHFDLIEARYYDTPPLSSGGVGEGFLA